MRDYFQYWKANGMTSESGKMLLFNPSRSTERHEMFFDDNIRYGDFYIVQPINVVDPERKHWVTDLLKTHLCRAEPLESVSDRQYFVKQVARLEGGYERKLLLRERLQRFFRM